MSPAAVARFGLAAVLLLVVALAGCGRDDHKAFALDGSPRHPDDEGVATSVSLEEITLDGERTYRLSRSLRSFSTYTLKLEPVLGREGHYVQVGLDGDEVVWLAGIAAVVQPSIPGGEPSVYYTGTLVEHDGDLLIFEDGTVLRAVDELPDVPAGKVTVRIDPRIGKVTLPPGAG